MQSPVKKIFITQIFGVNPQAYAKFGLLGHNGLDMRAFLPNGERCYDGGKSEVFAPHDGKIIESVFDANGYGWYVKIENDKEGSVLAHFSHQSPCKVGSTVKTGQFIGYQGTTGNSTGIHLHWGYYKFPRDKSNGYNGFINQEGLYTPFGGSMSSPDDISIPKKTFEELVTKSSRWDEVAKLGYTSATQIEQEVSQLKKAASDAKSAQKTEAERAEAARKEFNSLIASAAKALNTQQEITQVEAALTNLDKQLDDFSDLQRSYAALQLSSGEKEEEMRAEIAKLEALIKASGSLAGATFEQLLAEFFRRIKLIMQGRSV